MQSTFAIHGPTFRPPAKAHTSLCGQGVVGTAIGPGGKSDMGYQAAKGYKKGGKGRCQARSADRSTSKMASLISAMEGAAIDRLRAPWRR